MNGGKLSPQSILGAFLASCRFLIGGKTGCPAGLGLLLAAVSPSVWGEAGDLIKAGFITKFPEFIQWPSDGGEQDRTFDICVLGTAPMLPDLRGLALYTNPRSRLLEIRVLGSADQAAGCEILYLGASVAGRLESILAGLSGKTILTVADTPGFARRGVMINLHQRADKIYIHVNLRAVRASPLRFSFRLLEIAKIVE